MNFKIRMRRINRGIVLGLVLIIMLAVYLVISHFRFVNATQSIKDDAEAFFKELYKAAESDIEGVWTKEQIDAQVEKLNNVYDKYWTDEAIELNTEYNSYDGVQQFKKSNELIFKYNNGYYAGNVSNTEVTVKNVKISKFGNSGALYTAKVSVKMIVPMYQSFPSLETFYRRIDDYVWSDLNYDYDRFTDNLEKGKLMCESADFEFDYDVSIRYLYVDGEWRISESNNTIDYDKEPSYSKKDDLKTYDIKTGKLVETDASSEDAQSDNTASDDAPSDDNLKSGETGELGGE